MTYKHGMFFEVCYHIKLQGSTLKQPTYDVAAKSATRVSLIFEFRNYEMLFVPSLIILPTVLYGCETLSLPLMKEQIEDV
jgi:hypothetical protein